MRINSKRLCCSDFLTPGVHAVASLIVASFCRSARRPLVERSIPLWQWGLPDIPGSLAYRAAVRDRPRS